MSTPALRPAEPGQSIGDVQEIAGATTEPTEADYLQPSPFSFDTTVTALTEEMK